MSKKVKPPPIIIRNGREYVDAATYKGIYDYAEKELGVARAAGLPYITVMWGIKDKYYYNIEACEAWHRGEAV